VEYLPTPFYFRQRWLSGQVFDVLSGRSEVSWNLAHCLIISGGMMGKKVNDFIGIKIGAVYGAWTVIGGDERRGKLNYRKCKCRCGTERVVCMQNVLTRGSSSCGGCDWAWEPNKEIIEGRKRMERLYPNK